MQSKSPNRSVAAELSRGQSSESMTRPASEARRFSLGDDPVTRRLSFPPKSVVGRPRSVELNDAVPVPVGSAPLEEVPDQPANSVRNAEMLFSKAVGHLYQASLVVPLYVIFLELQPEACFADEPGGLQ